MSGRKSVKTFKPKTSGRAKLALQVANHRAAVMAGARAYPTRLPAGLYATARGGSGELKCMDVPGGTLAIHDTGLVTFVPMPQEGSSFYNRIGRRIRMKSIEIRGHIRPSYANAAQHGQQFVRILVIYDRQVNGAAPVLADILTAYSNAGGTSSTAYDGLNMNNRDRFQVLRDRKVVLPSVGVNGAVSGSVQTTVEANQENQGLVYHEFIKTNGLETQFKASSNPSVVGDVATGAYFIVTISSSDNNPTPCFLLNIGTRLKYYD